MAEFSEARAYGELAQAASWLGMDVTAIELAGGVAFRSLRNRLGPLMNRVIGLGLREPITVKTIDAVKDHYAQVEGPWCIELTPPAVTEEAVSLLRTIPMRKGLAAAILAIECRQCAASPTDLEIVKSDGHACPDAAAIEAAVFGVSDAMRSLLDVASLQPGLHHWLAYDKGVAVGACITHVDRGCAWFGWSATLPHYRGRGVQRALLTRCVQDAAAAGCQWMTAETAVGTAQRPDTSYTNLRRAGFVELYRRNNHLFMPRRPRSIS